MTNRSLKSLIRVLRSQGVVSYKHEGLELLLDPNFKPEVTEPKHVPGALASELNRAAPGFQGMSDEEVLFWSAPKIEEGV